MLFAILHDNSDAGPETCFRLFKLHDVNIIDKYLSKFVSEQIGVG